MSGSKAAEIDQQLLELLAKRIDAQEECPTFQEATELVATFASQHPIDSEVATNFLRHVHSICARTSRPLESVAYLGPIYSYSYLAAVKHFGLATNFAPVLTIAAAFEEVIREQSRFAVVPIENSTDGRVVDTFGMFAKSPVQICGEVRLPIHHCLLGKCERSAIQEVQSKPQALSQCRSWIAQHLAHARVVEVSSTAVAASAAAELEGVAAIAAEEAGIHHGLNLIDKNIEDNRDNVTRFVVIGDQACSPTGEDKTSLMFQLEHRPGALASAMVIFQAAEVNLTWIESFPLPNAPAEYLFYVELEGHRSTPHVAEAIQRLQVESPRLDVLGSYPRGL